MHLQCRHLLGVLFLNLLMVIPSLAQVPVQLGPEPQTQFLDQTGMPMSGGIVCFWAAGTNTPQAVYTDSTGLVPQSNPVILNSAGRANIWFSALSYKITLAGGGTCSSPSNLQWTVDNFSVGNFASGNNNWSGTNTFSNTTTFTGPVVITNGGTFNGSIGGNPTFTGALTFSGSLSVSQLVATVGPGTPPIVVTSTTVVPNLNVEIVNGVTFPASPSLHTTPVITATNTATYKVIPDCNGTTGSLQYTQFTDLFSCATDTPGSVNCPASKAGYALTFTSGTWSCTEIIPPVLKKGSNGGNYVAATGTFAAMDATNLAYTVTIPTGSNLTVTATGTMSPTGGTSTWYVALYDGASKLTEQMLSWTAAGASNACPGTMNCGAESFNLSYVIAGDGASHTVQLEYSVDSGSNDTTGRTLNTGGIFPTMLFTLQ